MAAIRNSATQQVTLFDLVTAGHHFLLDALPFRDPESLRALAVFVDAAASWRSSLPELDTVLLRCLAVLNRHTGGRLPSLIDRYVMGRTGVSDCLAQFSECVENVLRYQGIGDARVQHAIAIITAQYRQPTLTPRAVAAATNVRLATLCVAFRRQTGLTLSDYIRDVRLQHAAAQLGATNNSIKEVWASVGYNHASNFNHDFKVRFSVTPREHRARTIRPLVREPLDVAAVRRIGPHGEKASNRHPTILIVDDDEGTRTSIAVYLGLEGYSTVTAANGEMGIRESERLLPEVILVDYHLGDMTGLECLRAIRRRPGGGRPAITLFTADWNAFDLEDEVRQLDATITSKLCDLDQIQSVVSYLSGLQRFECSG